MNDKLNPNDWLADDLLTVLAESRETPITGVAPVESAELSAEPTRREPPQKRVSAKPPARMPWAEALLDYCCYFAIFCAVALFLYVLTRDFLQKPLTQAQTLTAASVQENAAQLKKTLAEYSAPNVSDAASVSDEHNLETTPSDSSKSDLAPDPNAVVETTVNNENIVENVVPNASFDSNTVAETITNNENVAKNVDSTKTTIPDAAPLLENTLASNASIKSNLNSENVKPKETPPATPQIYTKKICDVKIGERAVGTNPQGANPLEYDDTIFERVKHYGYKLSYRKANGTCCHINLLRPEDWLEYAEIQLRGKNSGRVLEELDFQIAEFSPLNFFDYDDCVPEIWLELPEMGVVGWAKLEDVDKNVSVQPGPGNVVTGTFAHISDDVIDLLIEDQDKPIGCTTNHPFWSVDRQDFVDAGDLLEGERVQLYNGETKRVVVKLPRPGPQNVYNLEIYSEHAYRVTRDGILVHNAGCKSRARSQSRDKFGRFLPKKPGESHPGFEAEEMVEKIFTDLGFDVIRHGYVKATIKMKKDQKVFFQSQTRVYDLIVKITDNIAFAVEVKSGNASLTAAQRRFDRHMSNGGKYETIGRIKDVSLFGMLEIGVK